LAPGLVRNQCWSPLIRGSVSKQWNGGGEDSVHSSVVAPSPHGFASACRFFANATAIPAKKTRTPRAEM